LEEETMVRLKASRNSSDSNGSLDSTVLLIA